MLNDCNSIMCQPSTAGGSGSARWPRSAELIADVDLGLDRFTGPEPFKILCRLVKDDLHRHPLNDFNEIAGRILRRQQRESAASTHLKTFDMGVEIMAGQRVNPHGNGLANLHLLQLSLFEIRDYPDVRRHKRKEGLTWLNIVARFDALLGYSTVKRGEDLGIG